MSTQTLFRLGALATMVTAGGIAIGELIYLFGSVDTVAYSWFLIFDTMLHVFAVIALYTAQAKRGDPFIFIGFVLLIIGLIFYLMNSLGDLGLLAGALTQAQLERASQIRSFIVIGAIATWSLSIGTIVFGYGMVRARVFPRWAGILLLIAGMVIIFRDIPGVEYIFAVLWSVVWGWLGWALWKNPNSTARYV